MGGWSNHSWTNRSFARSTLITAACVLTLAAVVSAIAAAVEKYGSSGPWGIGYAAVVCLAGALAGNLTTAFGCRRASGLATLLIGMAFRLLSPLAVCLFLASRGSSRDHIAFVVYILIFYFTTLAFDTYWAVQRVMENHKTLASNRSA